ncbi:LlaJI family restriction endonuclease [Psychromonas sp. 14N.309.X.WAT.B.A12]|uniref:LlaJI family restriction endonuclease n=1 Tax=Psychromonas sp. 14N.309.X.WAT.B.A12 TaxID=2998322 RepID=UPI0025B1F747|nr:LlaJI family restriction endonuclease [Psychromonas sp. 14N.309.X.WAT.B.A12]MDN2663282.1 LlaJI family restriction endonuclease [Psychromonas sp. 14N.309.X.WAT.B.A12]
MSNIRYFTDRSLLKKIPEEILSVMRSYGLIVIDDVKIHFCGVLSYGDDLAIFLPRNHKALDDESSMAGHYLLKALLKYFREKESGVYSQEQGDTVIGGRSFSQVAQLLDDYRTNGLYVRRVKEQTINAGKVHWPRTIARSTAFPANGRPVYLDLATSRSRYIANCETAKIHAQVIRELFTTYGHLWFGNSNLIDDRLLQIGDPVGDKTTQIAYLERELRLSYSERDIFLIKGLIKYLRLEKGTAVSNVLIGVRKFHTLWEAMLDECLIGKYPVNSKLPVPIYRTKEDKFKAMARKGQRTDTVLKSNEGKKFAIVDAKYYEASSPQTAPGWPDLVKQFYYQDALSILEGNDSSISNHFIFPGTVKHIKSVHVAGRLKEIKSEGDCLPEYQPIYCHYQDPGQLLEVYAKNKKLEHLTYKLFNIKI